MKRFFITSLFHIIAIHNINMLHTKNTILLTAVKYMVVLILLYLFEFVDNKSKKIMEMKIKQSKYNICTLHSIFP